MRVAPGLLGSPGIHVMTGRRGAAHASNILEALEGAGRPLSAYDLLDRLRPTGVAAPLTVYRALDRLIASGKVHRIASLNAFVACSHPAHGDGEHAAPPPGAEAGAAAREAVGFALCERCGAAEEFVDAALFAALDRSLLARGFAPRASTVEVRGLCAACRAGQATPA